MMFETWRSRRIACNKTDSRDKRKRPIDRDVARNIKMTEER